MTQIFYSKRSASNQQLNKIHKYYLITHQHQYKQL